MVCAAKDRIEGLGHAALLILLHCFTACSWSVAILSIGLVFGTMVDLCRMMISPIYYHQAEHLLDETSL